MAVQVQLKGQPNGADFSLFGNEARIERVQLDKEVVFITNVDNQLLYMIPLDKVRLITPLVSPQQEIPRSIGENSMLKVHIEGDSEGDFEQICNRVEYTKKFNTMMAELFNVTPKGEGEPPEVQLLLAMPFDNLKYIDFNHFVETNEEPKQQKSGQGNKPKPSNKGTNKGTNKGSNRNKIKPNIKSRARN